ncbi:MAG: YceI family protein [Cryobacterium sp.]
MTTNTTTIPGYKAGTWTIDKTHSSVNFSIRHIVISKVKGAFDDFDATFETGENMLDSSVTATAQVVSISTGDKTRDGHLRTGDFFDAETYPTIGFASTGIREVKGDYLVDGNITIKGVTKPATFELEFGGFGGDPFGNYKFGATAKTEVNREDFGLTYNAALETGGMLLGDKVTITLELQAALNE